METTNLTPRSNKINPVATGIAGAVIGAGITAAAATMLRDKKNRQILKNTLKKAGTKAMEYCDQLTNETKKTTHNGLEKVQENIKDIKGIKDIKVIKAVKKEAQKAL